MPGEIVLVIGLGRIECAVGLDRRHDFRAVDMGGVELIDIGSGDKAAARLLEVGKIVERYWVPTSGPLRR